MTSQEKLHALRDRLRRTPKLAISFSGGVDSAFLLKVAADTLGPENVLALTARAANFPDREFREAEEFARRLGVEHVVLDLDIMAIPGFAENTPERCYFCKLGIFTAILEMARKRGFDTLADGANTDDAGDYRPGMRATRELGVASPLREAGLAKADIRALSRGMDLPFWDKPAFACLASRFPYGQPITEADMARIARAERYFLGLGFRNIRVRLHGDLARVEADPDEMPKFFEVEFMRRVDGELRRMGFSYAALDLRGYRTGSMNETLGKR